MVFTDRGYKGAVRRTPPTPTEGLVGRLAGFALLLGLTLFASSAAAVTITGAAVVTKPYAFSLDGYTVFLLGVDSVEQGQTCTIERRNWDCWAAAQRQLETIVGEGMVSCEVVVGPDPQSQVIAVCTVNGEDVGERFVRSGFGIAIPSETQRYDNAQADAQASGRGLWQGEFAPPAIWRLMPFRPRSSRPLFPANGPI